VIFAGRSEHPGDHGDVVAAEDLDGFAPEARFFADRVQRDLHAGDPDGLEILDELRRFGGLEGPTANRQPGRERGRHIINSSAAPWAAMHSSVASRRLTRTARAR